MHSVGSRKRGWPILTSATYPCAQCVSISGTTYSKKSKQILTQNLEEENKKEEESAFDKTGKAIESEPNVIYCDIYGGKTIN